jgi:hypothetical protein
MATLIAAASGYSGYHVGNSTINAWRNVPDNGPMYQAHKIITRHAANTSSLSKSHYKSSSNRTPNQTPTAQQTPTQAAKNLVRSVNRNSLTNIFPKN